MKSGIHRILGSYIECLYEVRVFQALTAVLLEMQVLWNNTLWRLVNNYRGREHLQCQVGQEEK